MARPQSRHPTELELEILKVLWRDGSSSGRNVRDALAEFRDLAYTSVMTILGIMEEKGYVRRKKKGNSYVYSARIREETVTRRMLRDIIDRAFHGSVSTALVGLLKSSDIDPEELRQLKELIQRKSRESSQ